MKHRKFTDIAVGVGIFVLSAVFLGLAAGVRAEDLQSPEPHEPYGPLPPTVPPRRRRKVWPLPQRKGK